MCVLYFYGLPFVVVLLLLLLVVLVFTRTSGAAAVVYASAATAAAAAAAAGVRFGAVHYAAAVRTATENGSAWGVFGAFSVHSTRINILAPWKYVISHLRPQFAYDTRDGYRYARSRRRASVRRGEAPLVHICIYSE